MRWHPGSLLIAVCCVALPAVDSRAERPAASAAEAGRPADTAADPLPAHARVRMGTTRFRHGAAIQNLAVSPTGNVVASVGADGKVRLWDFPEGRELRSLSLPGGVVASLAFSPDGKRIVAAPGSLLAWDVQTGKAAPLTENIAVAAVGVSFSPDGKFLAVASNEKTIHLLDAVSGKELRQLEWKPPQAPPEDKVPPLLRALRGLRDNVAGAMGVPVGANAMLGNVAISPDGKQVAAAGFNEQSFGVAITWDFATGKELHRWSGPQGGFGRLVYSPRGKYLAAQIAQPPSLHVFDTASGKEAVFAAKAVNGGEGITGFDFSADGKTLAVAAAGEPIQLLDPATCKVVGKLGIAQQGFAALAYSRDGKVLLAGGAINTVTAWDTATGKERPGADGHRGSVLAAALSAGGKTVVTLGRDRTLRTWDLATGRELRRVVALGDDDPHVSLTGAALTPGGTLAVLGITRLDPANPQTAAGKVLLIDVATGTLRHRLEAPAALGFLALSPDGTTLAATWHDGIVRCWEVRSGKELRSMRFQDASQPDANVAVPNFDVFADGSLSFSPDGRLLATRGPAPGENQPPDGSNDMIWRLRVWELASGKERRHFTCKSPLEATQQIAMMRLGGLGVGDVGADPGEARSSVNWAPDGKALVVAAGSTISLCDALTGREMRRFGGPHVQADTAVFSRDGKLLAAGALDGTILLWDVATGTVLAQAAGHRGAVATLHFAADAKTLLSGGADTSALAWDVPGLLASARHGPTPLGHVRLQGLWDDLAQADAARAGRALAQLAESPLESVTFLKSKLRPMTVAQDDRAIAQLIVDLDSRQYAVREKAMQALEQLDRMAEPALRKALASQQPSLEVRRRLERVLDKIQGPVTGTDKLQRLRAVELLEQLGSRNARQLLRELAAGTPDAWLTQEARAALERLQQHGAEPGP